MKKVMNVFRAVRDDMLKNILDLLESWPDVNSNPS